MPTDPPKAAFLSDEQIIDVDTTDLDSDDAGYPWEVMRRVADAATAQAYWAGLEDGTAIAVDMTDDERVEQFGIKIHGDYVLRQEAIDAAAGLEDAHNAVVVALNRVESCQHGSKSNRNYLPEAWSQLKQANLTWDESLADWNKFNK